jgi:NAD(P)-dependent dehydrogenase (short-subunit alcohol dehydrogenase family)
MIEEVNYMQNGTKILENNVIVVIGSEGLLGSSFVKAIYNNGGIPICVDRVDNSSSVFDYIKADITKKKDVLNIIENVKNKHGKIDAVVNTSYPRNKNYGRKFEEVEFSDFCENLNMHLGGYFLVSQQFAEYFKLQGYGNIINIASIYGVIPPRFEIYQGTNMTMPVEYACIKSGIISLTKYIAKYYKGYNIRANCISPGGIYNDQPEEFVRKYNSYCLNKGMLNKEDINGTLIFLLSDMSKYINGQNVIIDDGFSL